MTSTFYVAGPTEPCDTLVSVSMTASQKRELRRIARNREKSMSAVARRILERGLHQYDLERLRVRP